MLASAMAPTTTSRPFIRARVSGPFWYGKWYRHGRPVIRALGRAWARNDDGEWRPRRGKPSDGSLTEAQAAEQMLRLMREHDAAQSAAEAAEREGRRLGTTFRELAAEYLVWLRDVKDAKPKTLSEHGYMLAEPGSPYARGPGKSAGEIMAAFGDQPAREITTRQVEDLLRAIARRGVAARTVNKTRQLLCAIFNYGMRPSTHGLPTNPAAAADRRVEPERGVLAFFTPTQIELLADTLGSGAHRDPSREAVSDDETAARMAEDLQDGDAIRIAAYTGVRRGELVALKWSDVNLSRRTLTVRRALSGAEEATSTKSRRTRQVPIPDQAAAAFERLMARGEFVKPNDYVLVNRSGRRLDPSALRRRYERARNAASLEPLRFHDLRHTYGSLLVASGVDLVSVKAAMGHARLTTTERYLHARPATSLASQFSAAFAIREEAA
jgi:integrase